MQAMEDLCGIVQTRQGSDANKQGQRMCDRVTLLLFYVVVFIDIRSARNSVRILVNNKIRIPSKVRGLFLGSGVFFLGSVSVFWGARGVLLQWGPAFLSKICAEFRADFSKQ
jgi:hypothetical protein